MITVLIGAAALSALLAIAADWQERRRAAFYLLKPLTTILIAAMALCAEPGDYRTLVLAGLLLSLSGDICLMFAGNRWFIGGLSSFLIAHGLFIAALLSGVDAYALPVWTWGVVLVGAGFFGWLLPKAGALRLPVLVYGCILMAMAAAAALRWSAMHDARAAVALAGALLFLLSDGALAVRKFHGPYRHAQALILSTYWLSIGLIAYSTLL